MSATWLKLKRAPQCRLSQVIIPPTLSPSRGCARSKRAARHDVSPYGVLHGADEHLGGGLRGRGEADPEGTAPAPVFLTAAKDGGAGQREGRPVPLVPSAGGRRPEISLDPSRGLAGLYPGLWPRRAGMEPAWPLSPACMHVLILHGHHRQMRRPKGSCLGTPAWPAAPDAVMPTVRRTLANSTRSRVAALIPRATPRRAVPRHATQAD